MVVDAIQIEVVEFSHSFPIAGEELPVLSDVNIKIRKGEFVTLIGPSGAGKSTLLKAICGLFDLVAGTVLINGESPGVARKRKDIGFVSQDLSLLPWLNVLQNISLPLEINPKAKRDVDMPERLVDVVGLNDFSKYYPHQLSGGMLQRVALARALVNNPSVLLMDEPLASLDEITRASMRYEVTRLWEEFNKTVFMVTHSISEAVAMSDRVLIMSSRPGQIVGEIDVTLPRPRERTVERSKQFRKDVRKVEELLYSGDSIVTS